MSRIKLMMLMLIFCLASLTEKLSFFDNKITVIYYAQEFTQEFILLYLPKCDVSDTFILYYMGRCLLLRPAKVIFNCEIYNKPRKVKSEGNTTESLQHTFHFCVLLNSIYSRNDSESPKTRASS